MDEHLKDRLAFMGSLASGLAHEIKNPLSTMTITLGLLHEDFENAETARERRTLRKIQLLELEVSRLETILQDFLRFAGGHTVRPRIVDVNDWLEELLDFFEPSCAGSEIRLVRRLGQGLPQILADTELLKQALLNLLTNAQQAIADGGELTVTTWFPGDRVRIDVHDTGPGIPRDVLPSIWQVYYSTKDRGSGLGLPTVRRIVAEHGGQVTVQSRPGHGTTFSVLLPLPQTIGGNEPLRLPGAIADPDASLTTVLAPEQERDHERAPDESGVPGDEET